MRKSPVEISVSKVRRQLNRLIVIDNRSPCLLYTSAFQPIHTPEEGEEYFLKPMNCPHHCEIYKNFPRSYKDLPLRIAEFGTVCRYEQSGELHGLTRVRSFTQDDAHIFCRPDQVKDEFLRVMDIISIVFRSMNFQNFEAQISLRDKVNREKYIGSDDNWEKAEQAIIEACEEKGLPAKIEYGEAAFYGPKLDFMVKDAIGRRWQLGTIQVDYNLSLIHIWSMDRLERILTVFCIVTGSHIQQLITDRRSNYFLVVIAGLDTTQELLQTQTQCSTFRQPHRKSLTYCFREHEQLHFLTDLTVVTFLGLSLIHICLTRHPKLRYPSCRSISGRRYRPERNNPENLGDRRRTAY